MTFKIKNFSTRLDKPTIRDLFRYTCSVKKVDMNRVDLELEGVRFRHKHNHAFYFVDKHRKLVFQGPHAVTHWWDADQSKVSLITDRSVINDLLEHGVSMDTYGEIDYDQFLAPLT